MSKKLFTKIYSLTKQIPKGKVATYKQIATLAGNSKASRIVGTAMRKNPDTKNIPCHRVIGSDGYMHGYSLDKGIESKIEMLEKEGIEVTDGKVDLKKYIWDV